MRIMLREKIILIILIVLMVTIGINNYFNAVTFKHSYEAALKSEVTVIGKNLLFQLERLLALGIPLDEILGFEVQCREVVEKHPSIEYALVVDKRGSVQYSSDTVTCAIPEVLLKPVDEGKDGVYDYTVGNDKHFGFVISIRNADGFSSGSIILGLPERIISERVLLTFRNSLIISSLFLVFAIALILWLIAQWVIRPLQSLERATNMIIKNGPESFSNIAISTHDEVGNLAESFNQMGEALQKTTVSKVYVDNIIAGMTDSLFVIDAQMNIRTVNKSASSMLQYDMNELIGKPVNSIFVTGETIPFDNQHISQTMKNGTINNWETLLQKKNGGKVPVLISCSVMDDHSGNVKSIIITSKDITERKLAEEALLSQAKRLERSNAELKEFVYIASHDLQEPLRKVCAFSERVEEKFGDVLSEQGRDYVGRIKMAGIRMQTLISDLLSYSRVTTKARSFEKVDLSAVVSEVVSDLQIRIEQANGTVHFDHLPVISAERTQMQQLFQNLIGNALKFHRDGVPPVITISTELRLGESARFHWQKDQELCAITITDNGIGIEKQYHQKIFGVFQRLHSRQQYEGSGVGLAICSKIVEHHNGTIQVESTLGEGTTFTVILPVNQVMSEDVR